jgi:3-hydroxyacyl-CoA dehydrogenase
MSQLVIRSAAVIGAGVMGSGIAAQLANSGIPTLLLDIVPKDAKDRNVIAKSAIDKQLKGKLCGFYNKKFVGLVREGNLEDDLERLGKVDWIIEAIPENLELKQALFTRLESIQENVKVISSNTSGIPLKLLTQGRSEKFCEKFLITHFFNPPRFMHLVEMVPGKSTKIELYRALRNFIEGKMGKGVVDCFDTPNFIANRVGCFDILAALKAMEKHQLTIEEVDTIIGPVCGRPKTGVFKLLDMVGIDTITHVIGNMYSMLLKDEFRQDFKVPDYLKNMVDKGILGMKNGKGFYAKIGNDLKVLDLKTLEYVEKKGVDLPELKEFRQSHSPLGGLKALCMSGSKAGNFLRDYLSLSGLYASFRIPEIALSVQDIDRAMRWGYNHEVGPFAILDAMGLKETVNYLRNEGYAISPLMSEVLEKGRGIFIKVSKEKLLFGIQVRKLMCH